MLVTIGSSNNVVLGVCERTKLTTNTKLYIDRDKVLLTYHKKIDGLNIKIMPCMIKRYIKELTLQHKEHFVITSNFSSTDKYTSNTQ